MPRSTVVRAEAATRPERGDGHEDTAGPRSTHVIVCGLGGLGLRIVEQLHHRDVPVVVVDVVLVPVVVVDVVSVPVVVVEAVVVPVVVVDLVSVPVVVVDVVVDSMSVVDAIAVVV